MRKIILLMLAALLTGPSAFADGSKNRNFAVTITNTTPGQTFTPLLVVTHRSSIRLFDVGEASSAELATIAESGNIAPMAELLNGMPDKVLATASSADLLASTGGLLGPGKSVTVEIEGNHRFNRVSVVGMLIPTNDTFVALNSAYLSRWDQSHAVPAYDAGSEYNDELCANIPGPVCGGAGLSEEDGEGFVHISSGIHGIGDLQPASYDWRNPVARVTVSRAD